MKFKNPVAALFYSLPMLASVQAQTSTWNLSAGGSWNATQSWSGAAIPTATDAVSFNTAADSSVTLDANQVAASLNATSAAVATGNANRVTLSGGGTNRTLIVSGPTTVSGSVNLIIGSTTSGQNVSLTTTSLTKTGSGNVELANANTIADVYIEGGNVFIRNANSLGTASSGVITLGAATGSDNVKLRGASATYVAKPIVLGGTSGTLTLDTLGATSPVFTAGITGNNNLWITSSNGGIMTLNTGVINHTGILNVSNTGNTALGTITLNAAIGSNVTAVNYSNSNTVTGSLININSSSNAYSGDTGIAANANVRLGANNVIPDGVGKGNVLVNGILNMRTSTASSTETINGLSGTGKITRSGATGTSILTVGLNDATSSFSGIIENGAGTVALTKAGSGTLTLAAANTYTGATLISAGTLMVNGSLGLTPIEVAPGGTLAGTGTFGGSVALAGTLSPGNRPGILSTGNQVWSDGGDYNWQILDAGGVAGSAYDTLAVTGSLDLGSLAAAGFSINLWSLSSLDPNLDDVPTGFDRAAPYSWTLASTTAGITGFEASDFMINTEPNNGTAGFKSTQPLTGLFSVNQSGNNLLLNYSPIPEPSATALALISSLVLLRRRRNGAAFLLQSTTI
jgi:autotransporter-associated beta strand protein